MTQEFLIQNSWLIALAVGSGGLLLWPVIVKRGAKHASVAQVTQLINQRKAVVIDIREPGDVQKSGWINGAVPLEIKNLKDKAPALFKNKEQPLIVVCQTGQKAGAAANILKTAGYNEVSVLEGGFKAWTDAGMPIKKTKNVKAAA